MSRRNPGPISAEEDASIRASLPTTYEGTDPGHLGVMDQMPAGGLGAVASAEPPTGLPPGVTPYVEPPPSLKPAKPDAQDPALQGDFLRLMADQPNAASYEALQYKLAYPQFDLDHIVKNLSFFRQQAQNDKIDWREVASQHPTLSKYLRDPDKASLALQDSALLSGAEKWIGRAEPTYGDEGKPGKPDWKYTKPFWMRSLLDAASGGFNHTLETALAAPFEVMSWAADKIDDALGTQRGGILHDTAKYWNARAAVWKPFTQRDYFGNSFRNDNWLVRGSADVLKTTTEMVPLLALGSGAMAGGGARGLMAFNTIYSAPGLFERAKETTGSVGEAAAVTALGAPLVGAAMGYTPYASASGKAISGWLDNSMAKVAAEMSPGFFRTARMWAGKVGADVFMGQVALGAQHAAETMVDQASLGLAGKDTDVTETIRSFFTGLRDPSMLGLHTIGVAREVGRFSRARSDVKRLNGFIDDLHKFANENAGAFQEEAVRATAQDGGDTHVYVPMDQFHETAAKLGDPKEIASKLFGDEGAAYAEALASHAEDLKIPVEKLAKLKELGLDKLVRNEGRFDPTLDGASKLMASSEEFRTAYEEATKADPEKLAGGEQAIYKTLLAFAQSDGDVAKHLFATVQGLRTQHPELTSQQIFDAVWGKGGVYGPRVEAEPSVSEGGNLVYSRPDVPLKLWVGHEVVDGKPTWTTYGFDVAGVKAKDYMSKIEELKGKGYATSIYLSALRDAQKAGAGYQSDEIVRMSDASLRMYDRLKNKYGMNVVERDGRYTISSEDLAKVDFSKFSFKGAETEGVVEPLIKQVEGPYTDKAWFAAFKDEQAKVSAEKASQEAQIASREALREALSKGTRKFMPEERAKAEEAARQDIRKDPVYRALHWFQKGELWGASPGEDARLRQPEIDPAPAKQAVDEARSALAETRRPELDALLTDQAKLPDLQRVADEKSRALVEAEQALHKAEGDLTLTYKLGTEKPELTGKDRKFVAKQETARDRAKKAWAKASAAWDASMAEKQALTDRLNKTPDFPGYAERLASAEKAVSDAEATLTLAQETAGRAGQPLRLLASDIDSLMGPGTADAIKENKSGIVTADPRQAIDVDAAANALGFAGSSATGDPARRMLAGLRDAVTEGQYVKHLADVRLKETYGHDLFEDPQALLTAINDAVHNEKTLAMVLRTYQALGAKLDPLSRARSQMTPEMWRAASERILNSKILKDTNPEVFARAGMRSAQRTVDFLGGGKDRPAFDSAEATVLNHWLYKVAREMHDDLGPKWSEINRRGMSSTVRKGLGFADPVTLNEDGTNRPAVYIDVHDAILRAIGALKEPDGYAPDPAAVNKLIERVKENGHDQWLSTVTWDPAVVQDIITQGKRWNRLTPAEAFQLHAMITNLQHLGKMATAKSQALGDIEIQTAKDGITSYLRGATGEGPTMLPAPNLRALDTLLERRQKEGGLRGLLTAPLRAAGKVADIFGWSADAGIFPWNRTSEIGPVGERIQAGFRERRNQRDALLHEFFFPWMEIRKTLDLDPKLAGDAKGADAMLGLRSRADLTDLSHQYLLNMARWWGDADGRTRLGKAFGLTPEKVAQTLARYLTPAQLDAVQAEKELIDTKMRPKLAAYHMAQYGVPLNESEPAAFTVKWEDGTTREYKGGYYPIHWDARPGMSQSRVGDFANGGRLPRVPNEFMIDRMENANYTPDLNWSGMPSHMLRVAHSLAFGDFVQDSARVLLDRDVQKEVAAYRGDDFAKGLGRWLERVALDVSGGPDSTFNASDKNAKLRILRRALVRSTVMLNYPIMFAHTAHPLGTGEARYGATYVSAYGGPAMADVLKGYTEHLTTGQNTLHDWAISTFPELQHRSSVLREEMGRWLLDKEFHTTPTSAAQKLMYAIDEHVFEGAGMAHLRFMDEAFSATTAVARYRKAIDDGLSHEEAVKLGDKEVFETMPTYSQMEQPEILADKHSLRSVGVIWHTYYGAWRGIWRDARYEGAVRPGEERVAATGKDPFMLRGMDEGQVFGRMMTGLGMALVLGAYFKGSGPEKHEKGVDWAVKRTLMAPSEVAPYAGALVERAIELAHGKKPRDMTFDNTYLSPLAHAANAVGSFGDMRKSREDRLMMAARAGAELFGVPKPLLNLGQFAYHGSEWYDRSPDGAAATATDFAAHVFYPYKWGRSSRFQQHNPLMDAASMLEEK